MKTIIKNILPFWTQTPSQGAESKCVKVLGLIVLLFAPLFQLSAQTSLSLSEAIIKGLENNYAIKIAAQDQRIAANNNTWGAAGRWPSINFNVPVSFNRSNNLGSFLAGRENLQAGLNLSWVLFDGFAVQANKASLAKLEEISVGNAAVVVENNIQAIILGYNNVLVAQAQLEVLQEVLDNSLERLEYENYRRELGTGSTFELFQFKNSVLVDSTNVITQQLNLRNARRNLNLVMGLEPDAQFTYTDSLQIDFQDFEIDDLRQKMASNNNNLKNQMLVQHLREQEFRVAKSNLYPRLALSMGGNYTTGNVILRNRDPDAAEQTFTRPIDGALDFTASLTLSFNLFNGGNTRRIIQNARINQEIAALQQTEIEQVLSIELLSHYDNYLARRSLFALQTAGATNAQLNLEMGAERFENGLINSFDYRTIQLQYLTAQLSRLSALRNLKESETEIVRLIGGLVRE